MIRIFHETETDFSHNGIEILDPITINCISERELNGIWCLNAEFLRDNDRSLSIQTDRILKVATPKGEQLFRIVTIKSNKTRLFVYAEHIFFDNKHNFITDIYIVRKTGTVALQRIMDSCEYKPICTGSTTLSTTSSARLVRKSLIEALMGSEENSFVNRWGGEIDLDNLNFIIEKQIGKNRGVEITYGHNMNGFEGEVDESGVITRIMPIGFDGLLLPEKFIDSPLINNYPFPKIHKFELSDIKVKEKEDDEGYDTKEQAYQAMRNRVKELFETGIDKPAINLKINIISLESTDQFRNEIFEAIYIGDTLKVNLQDYGFDVSCRVIYEKYDCLNKRYLEIELGEPKGNVLTQMVSIKETVQKVVSDLGGNTWSDILGKSIEQAKMLIQEGIKDSYVVAKQNEILIMDTPDVNTARTVIRMNKNGIGFSRTGYSGDYVIGITIDGSINASCIDTGVLNASLIRTGRLSSLQGETWIDLESGEFNLADKVKFENDTFSINLSNGKTLEKELEEQNKILSSKIDEVDARIDSVLGDVDGAISDGIINEAEASLISLKLLDFEKEKDSIEEEYNLVYSNINLSGTPKSQLKIAYDDLIAKHTDLANTIKLIIADNKATDTEKQLYNQKVSSYNTSFAMLSKAIQEALKNIGEKIKSDSLKYTDTQFEVLDGKISLKVETTYVDKAIDSIKIGGRNLLKNTSSELKEVSFGGWDYYFPDNLTSWTVGEKLTGRIYLQPSTQEASCMLHFRYTDGTYKQVRGNVISAGQTGYSQVTTDVPSDKTISHIQFSIRHSSGTTPTQTVYYKEAKVELASKYSDWTPAPEDTVNSILKAKEDLQKEIGDISKATTDLETTINTTFKDGIVTKAEIDLISERIIIIDREKTDLDNQYNSIYVNSNLTGTPKSELLTAKDNYNSAYLDLRNTINNYIADGKITEIEKTTVKTKLTTYSNTIGELSLKLQKALDNISSKKASDGLASAKKYTDDQIADISKTLDSFEDVVNGTFKDSIIEEAEAKAIKQNINILNNEKSDIDKEYELIYESSYLTNETAVKDSLSKAKTDYNNKHTVLITTINNAISDKKATTTEVDNVNTAFTNYRTSLTSLRNQLQNALDVINNNKIKDIQVGGKNYVLNSTWNFGINQYWSTNANMTLLDSESDKPNSKILTCSKLGLSADVSAQKWSNEIEINADNQMQLTLSFDIKITDKSIVDSSKIIACIRTFDELGKSEQSDSVWYKNLTVSMFDDKIINNKWVRLSYSFTPVTGKYIRVAPYLSRNGQVFWREFQLEKGNKASDYKESNEDILQTIVDTKKALQTEILDVNKALDDFEGTVNTTFKDGVIEQAEAKAIKQNINILDNEKADVDKQYTSIYGNTNLTGTAKTNLENAKKDYDTKHSALKTSINDAIKDGKTTTTEANTVNIAFSNYRTSLGIIRQRLQEAIDNIGTHKINNIQLGGRNLIPNTDFSTNKVDKYSKWGNATLTYSQSPVLSNITFPSNILVEDPTPTVAESSFGIITPKVLETLKQGVEYTLSFKAMSRGNTTNLDYIYIMSNEEGVSNQKINTGNVEINPYATTGIISSVTFIPTVDYPSATILIGRTDIAVSETIYNAFGIWDIKLERGNKFSDWSKAIEDYKLELDVVKDDLQKQVDGKIETWSQSADPSTSWTTSALKTQHTGDLWYNTSSKETKRWNGSAWVKLEDGQAANAESLAQSKKRVFTSTPTVPYDVGDLWITNSNGTGDLYSCKIARATGSYTASDWQKAVKYTDDTKANQVDTKVTNVTNKVTKIEETIEGINLKVETITHTVGSFRYLRDYLSGSSANTGNHWVEIQIYKGETNIAQGLLPTSNVNVSDLNVITDGNTATNPYASGGASSSAEDYKYVQIDLGQERHDIDMIKVWHYYADNRHYNHKLEVSTDGVEWIKLFDSSTSGAYQETADGRTYIINNTYSEKRLKNAEIKIQDENIVSIVRNSTDYKNDLSDKASTGAMTTLTQTVNDFTFKVNNSGGANLLQNGRFISGRDHFWDHEWNFDGITKYRGTISSSAQWCLDGRNALQLRATNSTTGQYGVAQTLTLKKNCTYTVSGYGASHRCNFYAYVQRNGDDWWAPTGYWNTAYGGKNETDWDFWSYTFTTDEGNNEYNFHFSLRNAGNDGYAWFTDLCVTEGSIKQKWSPHTSEIYEGIVRIDNRGVTVSHSDTNTYTNLSSEGLVIIDNSNNKELAYFGKNNSAYIDKLEAKQIISDDVIPLIRGKGNVHIYVSVGGSGNGSGTDASNYAPSITSGLEKLAIRWGLKSDQFRKGITLEGTTIVVNCNGTTSYSEDVRIVNIKGGSINLNFARNTQITGTITYISCDYAYVIGNRSSSTANDGARFYRQGEGNSISFLGCSMVACRNFRMYNTTRSGIGINAYWGGNIQVLDVDIYGYDIGISVADGSYLSTCNVNGHGMNTSAKLSYGSFIIARFGFMNVGASYHYGSNHIVPIGGNDAVATNSCQVAPPAPTYTSQTNEFNGHTYRSDRETYSSDGVFNQSHYNSQYGPWTGVVYFTDVNVWLSNSTGQPTAKIYLKRKNSAHGYPSGARPNLVGYGYLTGDSTGTSGLNQGQGDWFTVPTSIVNELKAGTRNWLSFKDTSAYHYILFETNAVLKVTASKPN